MQEEQREDTTGPDDAANMPLEQISSSEESIAIGGDTLEKSAEEHGGFDESDADPDEDNVADRRKYPRSEFTYPVEFKLFNMNADQVGFKGYLKDISISGACLQYEDMYGRFNPSEKDGVKIKLFFSIPHGEKVNLFARIKWVNRINPKTFSFKMGIEFHDMERWQIEVIEKLMNMRNKDHNMMWNLWEQFESYGR